MADPELDVPAPIQTLAVIREEHIQFYDDELTGAQVADGTVYIPLRPICDYLQLNWSGQRQRTLRDAALAETVQTVEITTNQGLRPMFCLPLEMLPGWLFGLNENKVRPDLQAKVKRYRRECFTVLWRAFGPQRASPLGDTIEPRTGAELALEIAEAVAALARQQVDLEGRYTTMADYMRSHVVKTNQTLRRHEERLAGQEDRIEALELRVGDMATITPTQAGEIAEAVKLVAEALGIRDGSNQYQAVYRELYKRFGVGSYAHLTQPQYDDARAWLQRWFQRVAPPSPPDTPDIS